MTRPLSLSIHIHMYVRKSLNRKQQNKKPRIKKKILHVATKIPRARVNGKTKRVFDTFRGHRRRDSRSDGLREMENNYSRPVESRRVLPTVRSSARPKRPLRRCSGRRNGFTVVSDFRLLLLDISTTTTYTISYLIKPTRKPSKTVEFFRSVCSCYIKSYTVRDRTRPSM